MEKEIEKRDLKIQEWCLEYRVHCHPERFDHQTKMTELLLTMKERNAVRNSGKTRKRNRFEKDMCTLCRIFATKVKERRLY